MKLGWERRDFEMNLSPQRASSSRIILKRTESPRSAERPIWGIDVQRKMQ